jgi:hypothetical protein
MNGIQSDYEDFVGKQVLVTVAPSEAVTYSSTDQSFDTVPPSAPLPPDTGPATIRASHDIPRGRRKLTISGIDDPDDGFVELEVMDADGVRYVHEFHVAHADPREQQHGRDIIERILNATNEGNWPDNLCALIGRQLEVVVTAGGEARYMAMS